MSEKTINEIKAQIDDRQNKAIRRLATKGIARATELLWRQEAADRYNLHYPAFTVKERANLRKFLSEYIDSVDIMERALIRWKMMRLSPNLNLLGEMPTFGEFFAHRQKIYVWLSAEKQRESIQDPVSRENLEKKTEEKLEKRNGSTFTHEDFMRHFHEGRRQAREQREKLSAEKQ